MKTVIFNNFKEMLLTGKVSAQFKVNVFLVKSTFFETYCNDDLELENFKTLDQLNEYSNILKQLSYTRFYPSTYDLVATFDTEYISEQVDREPTYDTNDGVCYAYYEGETRYYYGGANMKVKYADPRDYFSNSFDYDKWLADMDEDSTIPVNERQIPRKSGVVKYIEDLHAFCLRLDDNDSSVVIDSNTTNDGTVIHFGTVPWFPKIVQDLASSSYGYVQYQPYISDDVGGFIIADEEGNLIEYVNFEVQKEFYGTFSFKFKNRKAIDLDDGNGSLNYAILFDIVWSE